MKTPFKLKSGNTTPFKQMGAEIPLYSTTTLEEKALQSKIAKEFKLPVSKKGSMPKGFNVTGSKASTTPGYSTTKKGSMPKNFNITGSSKAGKKILTKQEKAAKYKKAFDKFQSQKQKGKQFVKDVLKKGGKIASKTARGSNILALLLGSTTTSKADQLKVEKSEREQMRDILTRHNLKGGRK